MSKYLIIKCLIAFLLGYLIFEILSGNGFSVGGQSVPVSCNNALVRYCQNQKSIVKDCNVCANNNQRDLIKAGCEGKFAEIWCKSEPINCNNDYIGAIKWTFDIGEQSYAFSPAIGLENTVYVHSENGILYSINPKGDPNWKLSMTGIGGEHPPTVAVDGTVYIGTRDGFIYAIYPNSKPKWKVKIAEPIFSEMAITNDSSTMYIKTQGGPLYSFNTENGSSNWFINIGVGSGAPLIDEYEGSRTVYVGTDDGTLYSINGDTNFEGSLKERIKWQVKLKTYTGTGRDEIYTKPAISPLIDNKRVVCVSSSNNHTYGVSMDGNIMWDKVNRPSGWSSPAISTDGTLYCNSTTNYEDQKQYGYLDAMNAITGKLKWSFATKKEIYSSPVIASDGTVYVGSNDKNVYAIDHNGKLKWKVFIDSLPDNSSPVIATDGTVYIGSLKGKLYAICP